MVGCGNVILSSVHWWLTTLKTFLCIESRSPIALCANHQNRHLEKGIHCCGSWETIGYTSKTWYLRLREMRRQYGKQDNIWKIEQLEPQKVSSGIWNASLRWLLSYQIFFILHISVCVSVRWPGKHPSSDNIPESTNSTSSGRWCLQIPASLASTSHIARCPNEVVRRWKHWDVWLFQFSRWLF